MKLTLKNISANYMSEGEMLPSDIFFKNIEFEEGKKYLIYAKSGKGKTSVLNFIYGSNLAFSGEIFYNDNKLKIKEIYKLRYRKISYVFQDLKLLEDLTAIENINLINQKTKFKTEKQINELFEEFNISQTKNKKIKFLSLGQRQRIAIIRALCVPFEILLLDEPFSHIDDFNAQIISQVIEKQSKAQNATIITTSLSENFNFFNIDKTFNL